MALFVMEYYGIDASFFFFGGCMMVESIACLLTETGDAGSSPHVSKGFFQWWSMTNNAINIINILNYGYSSIDRSIYY